MLSTFYFISSFWLWLHLFAEPAVTKPPVCQGATAAYADTTIVIRALAGLQYEQTRLVVKPKTRFRIVLENADDMSHNLVVTRPNSRMKVVEAALKMGTDGAKKNYVPNLPEVIANIPLLEPSHTDTLTLTLDEGAYPFVCTYPGHGYVMYGVIHATREPKRLPPVDEDPYVPKRADAGDHAAHGKQSAHPYKMTFPALYRTFMPECGPAAIAVGLPADPTAGQQSYCWDAGSCRLRYAWTGGFVDSYGHWEGNGNRLTKVVGDIYYNDRSGFPFRIGTATPVPQFKGYELVNRYPKFSYSLGSVQVTELIRAVPGKRGLVRQFTLSAGKLPVTFLLDQQEGVQYQTRINNVVASAKNGRLELPAGTRQFSVTMLVP
nr:plastocyanin/azurin family copper-binding protein [uncultured Arsenicibacter sp.]